jgi:mycobactin salicyl-AMP ligase
MMQAARASDEAVETGIRLPGLDGLTFDALLKLAQRRNGEASAIACPVAGRAQHLSADQLGLRVSRLAGLLGEIGATPGQHLAILAPMGLPVAVALLAALRAGMVPFLVPVEIDQAALTRLLEHTGTEIAIGVDAVGTREPLLMLREAASHIFGMRCVAGFGPTIPDGVMALDQYLASATCPVMTDPADVVQRRIGVVDPDHHVFLADSLTEAEVLEAGLQVVQALEISPESRIASTMVGSGLSALATGLAAALLSGAEFMPLGLFSLYGLEASLSDGRKVHLVAPASTATALLKAGLAHHPSVASLVLVHLAGPAPRTLTLPGTVDVTVVDVFWPVTGTIGITVRRPTVS